MLRTDAIRLADSSSCRSTIRFRACSKILRSFPYVATASRMVLPFDVPCSTARARRFVARRRCAEMATIRETAASPSDARRRIVSRFMVGIGRAHRILHSFRLGWAMEEAMDETTLRSLLERCAGGELSVDEAVRELRYLPYSDLGFARVDHHRELRLGLPEAVYGPGKTAEQVAAIVAALLDRNRGAVLVTRATKGQHEAVAAIAPEAEFHELAGLIVARPQAPAGGPPLAVVSAGTADLPVAEEAAVTGEALGLAVERLHDVGVAGLHRLLASRAVLDRAGAVIVVAGMEGALASVVGGLVAAPVVAVPTSVGYGAGAAVFAKMMLRPRPQGPAPGRPAGWSGSGPE